MPKGTSNPKSVANQHSKICVDTAKRLLNKLKAGWDKTLERSINAETGAISRSRKVLSLDECATLFSSEGGLLLKKTAECLDKFVEAAKTEVKVVEKVPELLDQGTFSRGRDRRKDNKQGRSGYAKVPAHDHKRRHQLNTSTVTRTVTSPSSISSTVPPKTTSSQSPRSASLLVGKKTLPSTSAKHLNNTTTVKFALSPEVASTMVMKSHRHGFDNHQGNSSSSVTSNIILK
ncbi:hypothetical protein HDU76_005185, partial [Blyttiomyces sp. JEL0837]